MNEFETTFSFPLSQDNIVLLKVRWPMSQPDYDLILATLALWRPVLTIKPNPPTTPEGEVK